MMDWALIYSIFKAVFAVWLAVLTTIVLRFMVDYEHQYKPLERTAVHTVGVIFFIFSWVVAGFVYWVIPALDLVNVFSELLF